MQSPHREPILSTQVLLAVIRNHKRVDGNTSTMAAVIFSSLEGIIEYEEKKEDFSFTDAMAPTGRTQWSVGLVSSKGTYMTAEAFGQQLNVSGMIFLAMRTVFWVCRSRD